LAGESIFSRQQKTMKTIQYPFRSITAALAACILMLASTGHAAAVAQTAAAPASAGDEEAELAKQLNNPVAALISVPFQGNEDFRIGPAHGNKFTLNIQPVIPISLNKDWNLILRTILPIISQNDVYGHSGSQTGLGDTTQSFFLSPKEPVWGGLIVGAGPVMYYPTATNDLLGGGKWGMGPTFVVLKQMGGWTVGMLANQIWSVGGDSNRNNISAAFLQPFVSYTTKTHTTFAVNTESTFDFENSQWTVPLNFMVSQVFKIGSQPMSVQLGARYYADGPSGHANWGMRLNFTLLFPLHHETPKELETATK
jgi:hypothetical protein